MATYAKSKLSGSTNGMSILVTSTSSGSADTVHTAVSGTANYDEVWLWATNEDTVARKLTIEFGKTSSEVVQTIPAQSGAYLCIPGWVLNNAKVVTVFADTANVVSVNGYVNAITN